MQFSKSYTYQLNWYAILEHLESSEVASYAFFDSNGSNRNSYLFISSNSKSIDLKDVSYKSEAGSFGFLSYDLKNVFENLESENHDILLWPDYEWFNADLMIEIQGNNLKCFGNKNLFDTEIEPFLGTDYAPKVQNGLALNQSANKEEYIDVLLKLKNEIQKGNIYEVNYCLNFSGEGDLDPIQTFFNLNHITKAPHSALMKSGSKYIISGSPERFLKKSGSTLTSEPIKGTARRDVDP